MALVKCPECGKENVSDNADMCPACGYGIKSHFDRIRVEDERREQEKRIDEQIRNMKIAERKKQEERINNIKKPEKPKFNRVLIIYSLLMSIGVLFLGVIAPIIQNRIRDIDFGGTCFMLGIFVILPLICYTLFVYLKKREAYELAEIDFDEYKKQVIKEQDELTRLARQNMPEVIIVKCPNCGSTSTKKITTTSRMTSVAMVGIASDKIGKQYECTKCKYKW